MQHELSSCAQSTSRRLLAKRHAFVQAGGGTEFAKTSSVKVIRKGGEGKKDIRSVNLERVMKKGDLEQNVLLAPGDIVVIP